jgi:hypothetical protein
MKVDMTQYNNRTVLLERNRYGFRGANADSGQRNNVESELSESLSFSGSGRTCTLIPFSIRSIGNVGSEFRPNRGFATNQY